MGHAGQRGQRGGHFGQADADVGRRGAGRAATVRVAGLARVSEIRGKSGVFSLVGWGSGVPWLWCRAAIGPGRGSSDRWPSPRRHGARPRHRQARRPRPALT